MPTIARRLVGLEQSRALASQLLLVFLDGTSATSGTAAQCSAITEAAASGQLVMKVRFVSPDKATEEQP